MASTIITNRKLLMVLEMKITSRPYGHSIRPSRQPFSCSELTTRWKLSIPANRKVNQRDAGGHDFSGHRPGPEGEVEGEDHEQNEETDGKDDFLAPHLDQEVFLHYCCYGLPVGHDSQTSRRPGPGIECLKRLSLTLPRQSPSLLVLSSGRELDQLSVGRCRYCVST